MTSERADSFSNVQCIGLRFQPHRNAAGAGTQVWTWLEYLTVALLFLLGILTFAYFFWLIYLVTLSCCHGQNSQITTQWLLIQSLAPGTWNYGPKTILHSNSNGDRSGSSMCEGEYKETCTVILKYLFSKLWLIMSSKQAETESYQQPKANKCKGTCIFVSEFKWNILPSVCSNCQSNKSKSQKSKMPSNRLPCLPN